MVEFLASVARSRDCRCLSVYTIKECGTVPIYEKLGFTPLREEPAKWAESDRHQTLTDVYLEMGLDA
jgi:hypothetical protein